MPSGPTVASRAGFAALIAANLLVAALTLRNDWGYYQSLIIYWLEAVILGFFTVLRLMVVGVAGAAPLGAWAATWLDPGGTGTRLFVTVLGVGFFVVKFGGFALVIGVLITLLPEFLAPGGAGAHTIHHAMAEAGPGIATAAGALFLSHGISFVRNFLMNREYNSVSVLWLVFLPYMRMLLAMCILALGIGVAALVPGLDSQTTFAVVMIILKMLADALSHTIEHRRLAPEPPVVVAGAAVT